MLLSQELSDKKLVSKEHFILHKDYLETYDKLEAFHNKTIPKYNYRVDTLKNGLMLVYRQNPINKYWYYNFAYIDKGDNSWIFSNMDNIIFDIISYEANQINANIAIEDMTKYYQEALQ